MRFRRIGVIMGVIIRLARLIPGKTFHRLLEGIDVILINRATPFKRFCQNVIATYEKG